MVLAEERKIVAPGILLKRNSMGHRVVRLHYSADPNKNPALPEGKKWVEQEASGYLGGMGSLLWRREMEIDFGAGSGELVFPEFSNMEDQLTIDPFQLDDTYTFFGGFDWGTRNPLSFHVYAESLDHRFYSVWEYYDKRVPVMQAARMIRTCPYYDRLEWIAADPTIWSETVAKKDSFTSIATMMQDPEEVGIYTVDKLMPAHDRSDVSGINKFRQLWATPKPMFQIFRSCPNQIGEFKNLKYPERKETVNETEKILDKNNHTWDDAKYFILSHPSSKSMPQGPSFGTMEYYNKISEMAQTVAQRTGQPLQEVFNNLYGRPA